MLGREFRFSGGGDIKDCDEQAWTAMLPGRCDISEGRGYKEMILAATPDPDRTEPYRLRGKRV